MIDRSLRCQIQAIPEVLAHYDDDIIRAVIADLKKAQIDLGSILQNRAEVRARYENKRKSHD